MDEQIQRLRRKLTSDPLNRDLLQQLANLHDRIGWKHRGQSLHEWIKDLEHPSESVSKGAMRAIKEIGPMAFRAIPALIDSLSHHKPSTRKKASATLRSFGSLPIPELVEQLSSPNEHQRKHCSIILENLGEKALEDILSTIHDDPYHQSTHLLASLGFNANKIDLLPKLMELFLTGTDSQRRQALVSLGNIGPKASQATNILAAAYLDPLDALAVEALSILPKIKPPAESILPFIVDAIEDSRWGANTAAYALFETLGLALEPCVNELLDKVIQAVKANSGYWKYTRAIIKMGMGPCLEARLLKFLTNSDQVKISQAIQLLRSMKSTPRLLSTLASNLSRYNKHNASQALIVISYAGYINPTIEQALNARVESPDPDLANHAVLALSRLRLDPSPYLDSLLGFLATPRQLQYTTLQYLQQLDPCPEKVEQALIASLEQEAYWSRFGSAETLAVLGLANDTVMEILVEGARAPTEQRRIRSIKALLHCGSAVEGVLPDLLYQLTSNQENVVALAAIGLGYIGPKAIQAIPPLIQCLQSNSTTIKRHSTRALSMIGQGRDDVLAALTNMLSDPNKKAKLTAVEELGKWGREAASVIGVLEPLRLAHPHGELSLAIENALANINKGISRTDNC